MKNCRYCDGKYEPSPIPTVGKGCSFLCKKDINDKKAGSKGVNSKPVQFSTFKDKPRKPLATRTPLKSTSSLKSKSTLSSAGMTGEAARQIKANRKDKALAKEAITPHLKDLPKYDIDALEAAAIKSCHLYIRTRDKEESCICCGLPLEEDYHAGHYKEAGSNSAIKFDERNIHAQRAECNIIFNGDRGYYEKNLRKKIGSKEVDRLNEIASSMIIHRYTAEDYINIKKKYDEKYHLLLLVA